MNKFSKDAQLRVFRVQAWSLKYADVRFSTFIRQRDGKCRRCQDPNRPLDCSHYWQRNLYGTRFEPRNCIALCRECHTAWDKKQNPEYKAYMMKVLGKSAYDALEAQARRYTPIREAILRLMKWME